MTQLRKSCKTTESSEKTNAVQRERENGFAACSGLAFTFYQIKFRMSGTDADAFMSTSGEDVTPVPPGTVNLADFSP